MASTTLGPAESLAVVVEAQDVSLAEHAEELALTVDDRERADVVLDEPGDRFAHGRVGLDGDPWFPLAVRTSRTCMFRLP